MNRLIATAVVGIPLAILGAVFGGPEDTAEGERFIHSLQAVETQICGCDEGDLMCAVEAVETLDTLLMLHANTEGTDSQLARAETVTRRIEACMEKSLGSLAQ